MKCEICGTINRDDAASCVVCGHRFSLMNTPPIPPQRNPWDNPNNISKNGHLPNPSSQQPINSRPMNNPQQPMQRQQPVPNPGMPQIQIPNTNAGKPKSLILPSIISAVLSVFIIAASVGVVFLAHAVHEKNDSANSSVDVVISSAQDTADTDIDNNIDGTDGTDAAVPDDAEPADPDAQAYADALQLEADGSYREAADAFAALDDYEDSPDRALYNEALADLDAGDKAEAAEIFADLGDFEDSEEQLVKCGLDLPDSAVDDMDTYFQDTLGSTYNGSSWSHDTLSDMELLGRYELISKDGDSSDNYVYLLYKVTGNNNAVGSMTYYWFGCYEDVTVSDTGELSYSDRNCFTNDAGTQYRLYINGSGTYYYYGFKTIDDFESDRINDHLTDYYSIWIPAD